MTTTGSESSPQTANQSHDVIAEIITDLILAQPDQIAQSPSHDGSTSAGSPGHRSRDRKRKCRKSQRRARFADFDVEKEASRSRDFDDTRGMTAAASKPPSPSLRASTAKGSEVDSAVSLHSTALPSISQDAHPHPSDTQPLAEQPPVAPTYPSPAKTALIMFSLYISIFLVALDRTIIGPAIPAITNQFHSLPDVGWYGSAYMLTSCGFILLYGRIYTFFPTKPVFLSGIALFEVGSAICGAANSSLVLIVGRAVAGLGSSGIFTGAILIMLNTVPLHKRPMLQGLFGACFGVASVTGPLLGGAFTGSKATWRWCFYINLPLGGLTIVVVSLLLRLEEQKPRLKTWRDLDPVGTMLFLPSITCLLLALEWGAADYAWSNPRIVALLTVFAVLFVAFAAWQYRTRDTTATVPARVLLQRSVVFGCAAQFCVGAAMLSVVLYVPIWFQAIQGVSAMQSGIRLVPLVLSVVVGSISSGALVQRIGYYTPFMIAGACLMAVGSGLITTWDMHTKRGAWIGFQVLFGLGVGWNMQHPNLAIQIVLQKKDVPTGTALLSLFQTLGGAVFVAVGQNVFIAKFTKGLNSIAGVNANAVVQTGATGLKAAVSPQIRPKVLEAYNFSLTQGPFFAALIVACLSLPAALGMEWRSVKEDQQGPSHSTIADEEKLSAGDSEADHGATQIMSAFVAPEADSTDVSEKADSELSGPVPAWRRVYRSSGQFSQWMTAKVNPDLAAELVKE